MYTKMACSVLIRLGFPVFFHEDRVVQFGTPPGEEKINRRAESGHVERDRFTDRRLLELHTPLVYQKRPRRPTDRHDLADLVEQLIHASASQAGLFGNLTHRYNRSAEPESLLGQIFQLCGRVDAELFQQRVGKSVKDLGIVREPLCLEGTLDPLLDRFDSLGVKSNNQVGGPFLPTPGDD